MSAVADVLNKAADLIERDGWCQKHFRGENGEHCLTDALMRAAGCFPGDSFGTKAVSYGKAYDVLTRRVRRKNLVFWNDKPGRTKDEVVVALRAAAERAA